MNIHGHGLVYAEDPEYQIAEGTFESTWQSLQSVQCPEWFRDAKAWVLGTLGTSGRADVRRLVRAEYVYRKV